MDETTPAAGEAGPARSSAFRRALRAIPWRYVGPLLSILLFGGALYVLGDILANVSAEKVMAAFAATPGSAIALSFLFTFLSYLALTGYDGLALRQIGAGHVPYSTAAIGAFTSYAISYTLGFPLLTAGTVRYRVYGAAGLSAPQIAALTLVCAITFWLGMGVVLASGLILMPGAVAAIDGAAAGVNTLIGFGVLALVIFYVAWVSTRRRVVNLRGWSMPLPGGRVSVAQILLGVFDIAMGSAALWILLPGDAPLTFGAFMVVYVLAAILGIVSHAPGGIGVFEATMLIALPSLPRDALLASLLLFRVIYYLVPFGLALAILAIYEIARRRHHLDRMVDQVSSVMRPLAPILAGGAVFLIGAVVLATGALPMGAARREAIQSIAPLPLVEAAHLLSMVAATLLLFVGRGLVRRLAVAWTASIILMAALVGLVILRGADVRLAVLLLLTLGVVGLSREMFPRKAPFFNRIFSLWWLFAVSMAIAAMLWLGFFVHRSIDYAPELWASFGYGEEMGRFLRGALAALLTAIVLAIVSLRRRQRAEPAPAIDRLAIVAASPSARARLALAPGLAHLDAPERDGFIAWARRGRSLIALGDPVGAPERAPDLIWAFRDLADRQGLWPVLLGTSPALDAACLEAGLSLTGIGETALVRLDAAGPPPFVDQPGLTLDVLPAAPGARPPPRARWADEPLSRFGAGPLQGGWIGAGDSVVLRRAGTPVAFATLLRGAGGAEWAIDSVRLEPRGDAALLEALIGRIMTIARASGAVRFDLGLTPTPDLTAGALGPTWHRVSPLLFGLGDQIADPAALRAFKARFMPEWRPRSLACPGGWALPEILLDVTRLIEQGPETARGPSAPAAEADGEPRRP